MTQIGEAIGVALAKQLEVQKCPFQEAPPPGVGEDPEDPADDDLDAAEAVQQSSGGVLGENLEAASEGKAGTINDRYPYGGFGEIRQQPRVDTARKGVKVHVRGEPAAYPFTVAAHHLIPGKAALAKSPLYDYMVEGRKVATEKKTYTIEANIGYNVNGAHNGVWLPGNYAIRAANPDNHKKKTWSALVDDAAEYGWCFDYMVAAVKKTKGQFHDTHTQYNENVEALLNKICTALVVHQDSCDECQKKDKVPPPYMLKMRLYLQSDFLKGQVTGEPAGWRRYFTSDRFREELVERKQHFLDAYKDAQPGD